MAQETTPYDLVIADLESKRDQISATIEMLRALRSTASIPLPLATNAQRTDEIAKDAFFAMTLPEAAKKYLMIERTTKPNPELCDALLGHGFKTQSANFAEVVRSQLSRHPEFVKVNGEWGLAAWYGNRGGGRKSKRGAQLAEELQDGNAGSLPEKAQGDMTETE